SGGGGSSGPTSCEVYEEGCKGSIPPVVASYQGNTTILPGFKLTEEDLLLITLAVFAESMNATHPAWAMEIWVWVLLNRIAQNPGRDVYDTVRAATDTWEVLFAAFGLEPDEAGKKEALIDIAKFYANGGGVWGRNFQRLYAQVVGDPSNVQAFDGGIYDRWRQFGSNSSADPSLGAIFAVHRNPDQFEFLLTTFQQYTVVNPSFNFGFTRPYPDRPDIMTVFGNASCTYDYRNCYQ